jgi:hypothetical protein
MNESETRAELIGSKLKACGWGMVEGCKSFVNTASLQVSFKLVVYEASV